MTESGACVQCGVSLPRRAGAGRPAVYCSRVCRAHAYRVRQSRRELLGRIVETTTGEGIDR